MAYFPRKKIIDHTGPVKKDPEAHKVEKQDEIIDMNDNHYEPFEPQKDGDI